MITALLAFAYVAIAAAVPYSASECKTLEELESWRHEKLDSLDKFMPKSFQGFASGDIERDYQKRKTELETAGDSAVAGDAPSNTPSQPQLSSTAAVPAPVGLAAVPYSASECNTLEQLESWRHEKLDSLDKYMPKSFQGFASGDIERDYQKRKTELETVGDSAVAGDAPSNTPSQPQLSSMAAGDSPEVLSASVGSNNAGMSIDGASSHAEQPSMEPQKAGGNLRHMLADVAKCNSREELEAWRSRVREFAEKELPSEFKPVALADMQRRFEIRLAELRQVSTAPEAQVLAQMLADVDRCTSEPELMVWRENVASHIRSHLVTRFQIPALSDMQSRFDRRLDIIQKSATVESSRVTETVSPVAGFGTFTLVLGGLLIPAFMAVFAAFIRAQRKVFATPTWDGEAQFLEP